VLLRPRRAVRAIAGDPRAGELFLVGSIAFALVSSLEIVRTDHAMARLFADGGTQEMKAAADGALEQAFWLRVLGAPVLLALGAAPAALTVLCATRSCAASLRMRAALSLALAGETPLFLGRILDLETLWRDGPEMTLELLPIVGSSASLASLVPLPPNGTRLVALADAITPFTVASAVFAGRSANELARASPIVAWIAGAAALGLRALGSFAGTHTFSIDIAK
jgi:hypothetical protein